MDREPVPGVYGEGKRAPSPPPQPIPDRLTDAAVLFASRNKEYGNSFESFAPLAMAMFPNGLTLKTHEEWNRFGVLFFMMAKIHRYTLAFDRGGHADSLKDLSVYSQMLAYLDDLYGQS